MLNSQRHSNLYGTQAVDSSLAFLTVHQMETLDMATENVTERVSVYKITCRANEKCYIGITRKALTERWRQHVKESKAKRFDTVLYRAMRLYGVEAFQIEELYEAVNAHEAQIAERALIATYNTLAPNGLNTSTGGESYAGVARTKEVRDKISASKTGHKMSPEVCAAMSERRKGLAPYPGQMAGLERNWQDPEVKKARSAQAKIRWENPEYRAKMTAQSQNSNGMSGRKHTEETKMKIRMAVAGKKKAPRKNSKRYVAAQEDKIL